MGENADRLRSEASFALLCGVARIPVSSGKIERLRLNRGGNCKAKLALHMMSIRRMRTDERTRDYLERRTLQGLYKLEVMRCLKCYVAGGIS